MPKRYNYKTKALCLERFQPGMPKRYNSKNSLAARSEWFESYYFANFPDGF